MNARILTTAFATTFIVVLPGWAADPQLLSLVMPDAVAVAGVNVDQARTSPFGQYILSQIPSQDPHLQQLTAQTGFDPTRDVHEILTASNSVAKSDHPNGLVLARGSFDPSRIIAAATEHGAASENYKGVTILEDPQGTGGLAFLNATIAIAGDLASVKGAIDRQSSPTSLPAALAVQINQWSSKEDAWAVSNAPLSSMHNAPPMAHQMPGMMMNGQGVFQTIQSGAAGVKFGSQVVINAQAQSDNAADAKTIADTIKMMANFAQLQAQNDPAIAAAIQSLTITPSGSVVNISLSLPEDVLQQMMKPKAGMNRKQLRKM